MLTSSTATSGRLSAVARTAALPSETSATTCMSGWAARTLRTPARTIPWSSARMTFVFSGPIRPTPLARPAPRGYCVHDRPPARPGESGAALRREYRRLQSHTRPRRPKQKRMPEGDPVQPDTARNAGPEAGAGAESDVTLRTPRLTLRRLRREDAAALCSYRSLPEVAKHQSWESFGPEDAAKLIEAQLAVRPNVPGTWLQLAIVISDTGEMVGD